MSQDEQSRPDDYEPPEVEPVPATDGPAVTAAGDTDDAQ
jgi:hypothetical protein